MAYRLYSLLPLLALCVSAATPVENADVAEMSENMDMGKLSSPISSSVAPITVTSSETSTATRRVLSVAVSATAEAPAQTPAQAPAAPAAPAIISSQQANSVIQEAVKKANEIKIPSNIAVMDPYGHLVSFLRMDGAVLASIDVAMKKAKTVSLFNGRYRTGDLFNTTSPGGALYGIAQTNNGLVFFGGGVPLKQNGAFVGSLGVSGGSVDQDVSIATAAANAFNK